MTSDAQRQEMQRLMRVLVNHRGRVHYAQRRPMATATIRPGHLRRAIYRPGGITMDCSESVTLICRLAGLRDPNGRNYDGYGYTGTLLTYLEHYAEPSRARPGALVVFGGGTGEHVAMVYEASAHDPVCFSHGTEQDPRFYRLSELLPAFPGQPHTFLAVGKLGLGH